MVPIEELFKPHKKQKPYNMGIQAFKRLLKENPNLTKHQINQSVKAYKDRINTRMLEIAEQFEKGIDNGPKV